MYISPSSKNTSRITKFTKLFQTGWDNGQLGIKSSSPPTGDTSLPVPQEVSVPANIKLMACGGSHTMIVSQEDKVYVCGRNQAGQLGKGDLKDSINAWIELDHELFYDEDKKRKVITSIDCGDRHSFIVFQDGKAVSFGQNFQGQLCLGHTTNRNSPQPLKLLRYETIVKVACGSRHTLLVTDKGKIWAAGNGSFGQLGNGHNLDKKFPVEVVQNGWKPLDIQAQEYSNVALSTNFEVYIWGGKIYDQQNEESSHASNVPRKIFQNLLGRRTIGVTTAATHSMALMSDGSIWMWGSNLAKSGYTKVMKSILKAIYHPDEEKNLLEMEKEYKEEIILSPKYYKDMTKEGGVELFRMQFMPEDVGKVIQIAASDYVNYALTDTGKVLSWGASKYHELGHGDKVLEQLKPDQVMAMDKEFVTRIVPGCFSAAFLTGGKENFHSELNYLDMGAQLPKSIERRNEEALK